MQEKKEYEGDKDYVQYELPPLIKTERMLSSIQQGWTPEKERAFTIANKARSAMNQDNFDDASKMSYQALNIDPLCIDGWRNLSKILNKIVDGDTVICNLREIINFSRQLYHNEFNANNGMFYSMAHTRPYLRILTDIAMTSFQSDQLDVTIYAYEEMLRLNHNDDTGARNNLLACYLKIIGRIRRFPSTVPKRTIEQAEQLMNGQISSEPLFNESNLTYRWARLCISYLRDQNWKEIATEENKKNDLIFKVVFNEIKVSQIPPENSNTTKNEPNDVKGNEIRVHGAMIREAMKDWPDFVIELCRLIKGRVSQNFTDEVMSNAPNPESELTEEHKLQMKMLGQHFLDQGRTDLTNKKFHQSIQEFTFAKRGAFEGSQPSRRWYLHAAFAIVSNRATAAAHLNLWDLVRIDTRYTIMMKPDHSRTYLRLPKIAEAFNAKQLFDDFQSIKQHVENNEVKNIDEWKDLSKTVIGLTSITAIAFAAAGILTEEKKEELIQIGIEDCYCSINVNPQYDVLPWLTPDQLEKNIPNV